MEKNEVIRYSAQEEFADILDGLDDSLSSNRKFDMMLNQIIVVDDYGDFRRETERGYAVKTLFEKGHLSVAFRIHLSDGLHYCKMKIAKSPVNKNSVIMGIMNQDEDHAKQAELLRLRKELAEARRTIGLSRENYV